MADIIVAHIVLTISLKCCTVQILPALHRLVWVPYYSSIQLGGGRKL